jgi:phosphotransferase system enzyme I (PtsI)
LRLIKNIIDSGHKENIWVGMCGEMAAEPGFVLILLGLGLDELSMSPVVIPAMKYVIRNIRFEDARAIAMEALTFSTGEEVENFISQRLNEIVPSLKKLKKK